MMFRVFQSIRNEQGKTAVIFFASMVVLAFLLHPSTSPFAKYYYNYKAETQLTQLYDSCKLVWAAGGPHNSSDNECDLATAVLSPYDFLHDKNVVIVIKDGTQNMFSATAKHKEGTQVIEINANGDKVS
jgi:hypothetical protein